MSEQTKSKTPWTERQLLKNSENAFYANWTCDSTNAISVAEVRKLEAVKIQMEEALREMYDLGLAHYWDNAEMANAEAALKASEELNNE